jgi:hypothetical protein
MLDTSKNELNALLEDLRRAAAGRRLGWERIKCAFQVKKIREAVENL